MKSQINHRSGVSSSFDDRVQLVVIVGTAYQSLARWLSMNPNAVMLIVDVAAELEQIPLSTDHRNRVFHLPVAASDTAQQLIKKYGTKEQAAALDSLPNMSCNDGQGQLCGIGRAGVRQLLQRDSTKRLFAQLLPMLTELSGGMLSKIDLTIYTSIPGGMGSLASVEFSSELTGYLASETKVPIEVTVHVIGGITFCGPPFPRTQLNSGSALTSWIDQCHNPVDDRITMSFYGHEVCPVGDDRHLRDELLLDQDAALRSPEVALRLMRDRSNRAVSGPLGNMCLISTDHFANMPRKQILRDIADAYLPDIEDLLETGPARSRLLDIEFDYQMSQARLVSPSDLALKAMELPSEDSVLELLECDSHVENIEPRAVLLSGSKNSLKAIAEQSSLLPCSAEDCSKTLGLLTAIEDLCLDCIDSLDDELANLEVGLDEATELVVKGWKKLDGTPFFSLKSDDDRFTDFEASIHGYQVCLRAKYEAEGEIAALRVAAGHIGEVTSMLLDRLQTLSDFLRTRADVHSGISPEPFTAAKPLKQTFESLITASVSASVESGSLDQCLCDSVAAVTRAGLRSMTGAADTSIDAIVDAVRCKHGSIKGPGWGGEDRPIDLEYVVFPPVLPADRQLLEDAYSGQHIGTKVAFSKPDAPSHNVVVLRVSYCREIDDVLTHFYRTGLRKAMNSPMSSMFVTDRSLPSSLGIKFE